MHNALHPRDDADRLYELEYEEEGLTALRTVLTHQYNDLKTTYKSVEEDWLQPPETIVTARGPIERR